MRALAIVVGCLDVLKLESGGENKRIDEYLRHEQKEGERNVVCFEILTQHSPRGNKNDGTTENSFRIPSCVHCSSFRIRDRRFNVK